MAGLQLSEPQLPDSSSSNCTFSIFPSQGKYSHADFLPLWLITRFVGVALLLGRGKVSMFHLSSPSKEPKGSNRLAVKLFRI